jgi:hypothetical protein
MRITVETILQYISARDTSKKILAAYPFLKEVILTCIAYNIKKSLRLCFLNFGIAIKKINFGVVQLQEK